MIVVKNDGFLIKGEISMEIKIKVDDLKKHSVFVATPMYGGMAHGLYIKSCLDLQSILRNYGVEVKFSFLFNESLITRARNYLVDEFLRSDCTHLLFIDSDIHFNPQDVVALLALDKDVAGAPYPKKSINWGSVAAAARNHPDMPPGELEGLVGEYVFNVVKGTQQFSVTDPLEVLEIGTGFMMVKRDVFTKLAEAFPLIRYRPDHVGQANFDGSRYIHAYYDTVIDSAESITGGGSDRYLSEDYMFCVPASSKISTEDGIKTIKDIVDSKYSGKVVSMDSEGKLNYNKIINWSCRKNDNKQWLKLEVGFPTGKSKLKCTSDHKVFYRDSLFDNTIKYDIASNVKNKYLIRNDGNTAYNEDQFSALIGVLLGDGTVGKNGQFAITHSESQIEYNIHLQKLFGGSIINSLGRGFGKGKPQNCLSLPINSNTRFLRKVFYDGGVKTVKNIIHNINKISLAYLYMDDGHLNGKSDCGISTCSFTYDEHLLLQQKFKEEWNINCVISSKSAVYKDEKRNYFYLRFNTEDSDKLFTLISEYIIPSMQYKLG